MPCRRLRGRQREYKEARTSSGYGRLEWHILANVEPVTLGYFSHRCAIRLVVWAASLNQLITKRSTQIWIPIGCTALISGFIGARAFEEYSKNNKIRTVCSSHQTNVTGFVFSSQRPGPTAEQWCLLLKKIVWHIGDCQCFWEVLIHASPVFVLCPVIRLVGSQNLF